jgi:hypothetical protein
VKITHLYIYTHMHTYIYIIVNHMKFFLPEFTSAANCCL